MPISCVKTGGWVSQIGYLPTKSGKMTSIFGFASPSFTYCFRDVTNFLHDCHIAVTNVCVLSSIVAVCQLSVALSEFSTMLTDVKVYPQEGLKSLAITKAKYEEYYLDVRAYERLLKKKERMLTKLEETYKDNIEKALKIIEWYQNGGDDEPFKRPDIPKPKPTGPAVEKLKEIIR